MTMPKTGSYPIVIRRSRLYPHLLPFFVLYDCIAFAAQTVFKGQYTAKLTDFGYAKSKQFPLQVKHPIGGLARAAMEGDQIDGFHLDVEARTEERDPKPGEYKTSAFQEIITNTIAPIFTNYFENHRPWLDANVSSDTYQWPSVWNFARIVRNGASHGGQLRWNKDTAPPVSWYHLSYDAKARGRRVFGGELVLGDLMLLLLEMDSALDRLGCPVEDPAHPQQPAWPYKPRATFVAPVRVQWTPTHHD